MYTSRWSILSAPTLASSRPFLTVLPPTKLLGSISAYRSSSLPWRIFKQAERLLIINTPLGKDKLLLYGFAGTEALSSLFHFELDPFGPEADIEPDQLIGKNVTFGLRLPDKSDHRWFNGYVSRFRKVETRDRITRFRAELVPWTWFPTRSTDCRTFVNKTVPQIVDEVFKDFGFEDYEFRLSGQYTPREYTVQYRETAFNFVSRLLEQEGIFYFYRHENGSASPPSW